MAGVQSGGAGAGGGSGVGGSPDGGAESADIGGVPAGGASGSSGAGAESSGGSRGGSCEDRGYCYDLVGDLIADCEAPCGGMFGDPCPGEDLTCLRSRSSMWNDAPLDYCVALQAVDCVTPDDCVCLPGDCSAWGGAEPVTFVWSCIGGRCSGSCE